MNARLLIAACAALVVGCTADFEGTRSLKTCSTDAQCADGEVCFADGCGDPGENLVVELLPNAANKQYIQDWPIEKLAQVTDIRASAPSVLQGEIAQEISSNGNTVAYAGDITVSAQGESLLIPGRTRSVTFTVSLDKGAFQVPVHSGAYEIALTTKDPIYPPAIFDGVTVTPGSSKTLDTTLRAVASMIQVSGSLLQTQTPRTAPQTAEYDVQAFDLDSGLPVSQRVPVSSGTTISDGSFVLWVLPSPGAQELLLKAFPRTSNVLAATKSFRVPVSTNVGELELGDTGVPVNITGQVVARTDHQPIANARVHVEGRLTGGGTFTSPSTRTDETGAFALKTLPTGREGSLDLVVEPPPDSPAGQLRMQVEIPVEGGAIGALEAPDRIQVIGSLVGPEGEAAVGVSVYAEPLRSLTDDLPTPRGPFEATTDANGNFDLLLDPGEYRLDFVSMELSRPRVSRFVRITATPGYTGEGFVPITLPQFALSRGRKISGTIYAIPRPLGTMDSLAPAPYASFRFFRVVNTEGEPSAILLAEGTAAADGTYEVMLPTR